EADLEDYVVQAERVDGLVARTAESVLAEWIGGNRVDDVLLRGKVVLPRFLVQQTQARLEPYRLGIDLKAASVPYLLPPGEARAASDGVTGAEASIRPREHEARQVAQRRLREAETEKVRIEQMTAAYVNERLQLARAEADGFTKRLDQYRRLRQTNPDVL